jgi:hypothetical protein
MKINIDNLLLILNEEHEGKYTVTMIKGYNEKHKFVYTKYILYKDSVQEYYTFKKQEFLAYLMDMTK